jgi:hypothetical protein
MSYPYYHDIVIHSLGFHFHQDFLLIHRAFQSSDKFFLMWLIGSQHLVYKVFFAITQRVPKQVIAGEANTYACLQVQGTYLLIDGKKSKVWFASFSHLKAKCHFLEPISSD